MSVILQDNGSGIWELGVDSYGRPMLTSSVGAPTTLFLNDGSGHSWQILIVLDGSVPRFEVKPVSTQYYPTSALVDNGSFYVSVNGAIETSLSVLSRSMITLVSGNSSSSILLRDNGSGIWRLGVDSYGRPMMTSDSGTPTTLFLNDANRNSWQISIVLNGAIPQFEMEPVTIGSYSNYVSVDNGLLLVSINGAIEGVVEGSLSVDSSSMFIPNGSISFSLNVDARVINYPGGFVSSKIPIVFQFDEDGHIVSNEPAIVAQIYSNAELSPQLSSTLLGTYYKVTLYDQNGARLNKSPMWWQFPNVAGSTVDIRRMIPISTVGGNVIYYPTDFVSFTPLVVVPSSATPIFNANLGTSFQLQMTGDVTSSTLTGASSGDILIFEIFQSVGGGNTFVWPSNVFGGMPPSPTAGSTNVQSFIFDGVNAYPLGPGYQSS